MSVANAWASVHALSMVMWYHQQIVVGQCSVMDILETFVLYKLLIMIDVLMLHIQLAILLCRHSALLIHVIHPFHLHMSQTTSSKHLIVLATIRSANGFNRGP